MLSETPLTRDLVLVGGGHAHALVLRAWGMDPLPGARLTVINPGPTAPYTGMLPGYIAGHYTRDALEIDLMRLCRHAGARLILDRVTGIDRERRLVRLAGRGPVAYDVASINVGIHAQMDIPGFSEHGIGAKPLDRYATRWRAFLEAVQSGDIPPQVAVIGGGVAGCELAMAMAFALRQSGLTPQVSVIEAASDITGMGPGAKRRVRAAMASLGITLRLDAQVTEIAADAVLLQGGDRLPAHLCVGAAGAFPHGWISGKDLPQQDGFIQVGRDLGVRNDRALFAVGDCSVMPGDPRPKAGVFAVRAAPVLHHNLRAALSGGPRKLWRPQRDYLKLISLGGKSALGEKFGVTLAGPRLWQWKDRIDGAFMDRLSDLPTMKPAPPRGPVAKGVRDLMFAKPLCGGCGAKVGQGVLSAAIDDLPAPAGEVVTGAGDDAAILRRPSGDFQVMSTDHLRSFIEDPMVMARIAAVHALGDVWAMGAAPQAALVSVILPQMTAELQARTLEEIMQALRAVLEGAGAQLVGGHTTLGAELTLGLTVTGLRDGMPLTVAGAQPGDVLVLTRPIGTGVLLAADMALRGRGGDLAAALDVMQQPQGGEARILSRHAHAMTDITGFGLAGHVQAICRASGLDASLTREAVPVYAGARALSDAGVSSSLMPHNRADAPTIGAEDPLLWDPQTAGGLLAAVPQKDVDAVLEDLRRSGCRGHAIGQLSPGTGRVMLS